MLPDELDTVLKLIVNSSLQWERPKFEDIVKTADSLFCGHFRKNWKNTEETEFISIEWIRPSVI